MRELKFKDIHLEKWKAQNYVTLLPHIPPYSSTLHVLEWSKGKEQ
jgi:hypothetical protein